MHGNNVPKGNTYRIYNKGGRYQQVIGRYPDQVVLQEFPSFEAVLDYTMVRGHLEEGAFNFLQFILGTLKTESVVDKTLIEWCSDAAGNVVYKNRAVRILRDFVTTGRGWQTYLSDKED